MTRQKPKRKGPREEGGRRRCGASATLAYDERRNFLLSDKGKIPHRKWSIKLEEYPPPLHPYLSHVAGLQVEGRMHSKLKIISIEFIDIFHLSR